MSTPPNIFIKMIKIPLMIQLSVPVPLKVSEIVDVKIFLVLNVALLYSLVGSIVSKNDDKASKLRYSARYEF